MSVSNFGSSSRWVNLHTNSGKTSINRDTIAAIVRVEDEDLKAGVAGIQEIHLTSGTIFSATGASEILTTAFPHLGKDYFNPDKKYTIIREGKAPTGSEE